MNSHAMRIYLQSQLEYALLGKRYADSCCPYSFIDDGEGGFWRSTVRDYIDILISKAGNTPDAWYVDYKIVHDEGREPNDNVIKQVLVHKACRFWECTWGVK